MNRAEYQEYLSHPLWLECRDRILASRKRRCERCKALEHLEVHHKTYARGKMPWEYPDENFALLCERCHANESSFEYVPNYCLSCRKSIRRGFVYCISCQSKRIADLERVTQKLQESQDREREQRADRRTPAQVLPGESGVEPAGARVEQPLTSPVAATTPVSSEPPISVPAQEPPGKSAYRSSARWVLLSILMAGVVGLGALMVWRPWQTDAGLSERPTDEKRIRRPSSEVSRSVTGTIIQQATPGARGTFRLRIQNVRTPGNGNVYLDVGDSGGGAPLSVVIFRNRRAAFGDLSGLAGKEILVNGMVTVYREQRQIIVESPSQIQLP